MASKAVDYSEGGAGTPGSGADDGIEPAPSNSHPPPVAVEVVAVNGMVAGSLGANQANLEDAIDPAEAEDNRVSPEGDRASTAAVPSMDPRSPYVSPELKALCKRDDGLAPLAPLPEGFGSIYDFDKGANDKIYTNDFKSPFHVWPNKNYGLPLDVDQQYLFGHEMLDKVQNLGIIRMFVDGLLTIFPCFWVTFYFSAWSTPTYTLAISILVLLDFIFTIVGHLAPCWSKNFRYAIFLGIAWNMFVMFLMLCTILLIPLLPYFYKLTKAMYAILHKELNPKWNAVPLTREGRHKYVTHLGNLGLIPVYNTPQTGWQGARPGEGIMPPANRSPVPFFRVRRANTRTENEPYVDRENPNVSRPEPVVQPFSPEVVSAKEATEASPRKYEDANQDLDEIKIVPE